MCFAIPSQSIPLGTITIIVQVEAPAGCSARRYGAPTFGNSYPALCPPLHYGLAGIGALEEFGAMTFKGPLLGLDFRSALCWRPGRRARNLAGSDRHLAKGLNGFAVDGLRCFMQARKQ